MKLAHFTDLHFRDAVPGTSSAGRRRSREVLPCFSAALQDAVRRGADLIAITGDLVDAPDFLTEGVPAGFAMIDADAWRSAVRQDYQTLRRLLEACGRPYLVLPGNHDLPDIFFEVFGQPDPVFTCHGVEFVSFFDYEQKSNVPRRLGPSRDLFDRMMARAGKIPQVHLQHYLLQPPDVPSDYPFAYAEHQFLRDCSSASGQVALCLSGHYHFGTEIIQERGVPYAVTPGFCDAPHRWRIYDISRQGVAMEQFSCPAEQRDGRVVFLDRDGVINDLGSYRFGPQEMRLLPGAAGAIRRLQDHGHRVVVVTSQSAIALGYVTDAVVRMVHERMQHLLAQDGAFVDAIYYTRGTLGDCVLPEGVGWATAKSSLIQQALRDLPVDASRAWLVGDRLTDGEAAQFHGIPFILVRTGFGRAAESARKPGVAFPVVADLREAVNHILASPSVAA